MAFDTTRRSFLKGIISVAAIPLVTPLMPMEVFAEEPPAPVGSLPPLEEGDFWLKFKDQWEFIGKVRSLEIPSMTRAPEIFVSREVQYTPLRYPPPRMNIAMFCEFEGFNILRDYADDYIHSRTYMSNDALIQIAGRNVHVKDAMFESYSETMIIPNVERKDAFGRVIKSPPQPLQIDMTLLFNTWGFTKEYTFDHPVTGRG